MVKVKICGITNLNDAQVAIECGADALGFNFYEKSPRYISPEAVREIVEQLDGEVAKIGVFVNSSVDQIKDICSRSSIGVVQLHGDETPELTERLRDANSVEVIKALRVSPGFDLRKAMDYDVDGFLLDTLSNKGFGGSGETFDWNLALEFKRLVPDFYLAGGLTPENVADAVRAVRPSALDVCSGVESAKGKKDPEKLAAFIRNAKNAL